MKEVKCPVCNETANFYYEFNREKCIEGYKHLYESVPEDLDIPDYQLYQCSSCDLVFANPMLGGSQSFYTWVTGHANYYPSKEHPRWEWMQIREYIAEHKISSILEIGCGKGDFLEYIKEGQPEIHVVGVDTTKTSCEECWEKGLEVYNELLEEYAKEHSEEFDMVVAFHCVEHVDAPLEFVQQMIQCMQPQGKCIVSFPYSELRIENCFSSSNNMPPHHMTRWNINACRKLAEKVGCEVKIVCPKAPKLRTELKQELKNIYFPIWTHAKVTDKQLVRQCTKHLVHTLKVIWVKLTGDRVAATYNIGEQNAPKRRMPWFVMLVLEKK